MRVSEAMKTLKVSQQQIQWIKAEDPNLVKTCKRRPGKFTNEIKTELLLQIKNRSLTTLPEMAHFLKDKLDISVSTQAISNLIHNMVILWKQVTNIPAAWNKTELLEQHANLVH